MGQAAARNGLSADAAGKPLAASAATSYPSARDGGTGGAPPATASVLRAAKAEPAPAGSLSAALADLTVEARALERRREESLDAMASLLRDHCGPDVKLTKATSVGGRMVFVLDGLVPDGVRESLYECLQTDAFRRTEFARPDTREFRHNVVEYNVEKLRRSELFNVIDRMVQLLFPPSAQSGKALEVYRIYTNAVMFGDAAFAHRDSSEPEHVTVIAYPNPEWASELGGETLWYDEAGEIQEAIEPRAGRVVIFRGNILHKGSPPTRLFWGSRFTTAFKYGIKDGEGNGEEPASDRPRSTSER